MYFGSHLVDDMVENNLISTKVAKLVHSIGGERVFSVEMYPDGVALVEECDHYFDYFVKKDELLMLADFFKSVHDNYDTLLNKSEIRQDEYEREIEEIELIESKEIEKQQVTLAPIIITQEDDDVPLVLTQEELDEKVKRYRDIWKK